MAASGYLPVQDRPGGRCSQGEVQSAFGAPYMNSISGQGIGSTPPIFLGYLLILPFAFLVFSFNYHFLWLFYDVAAFVIMFYFLYGVKRLPITNMAFFSFILVVLYFISMSIISGHIFFGVLSSWDTFKHIALLLGVIALSRLHGVDTIQSFTDMFYKIIIFSFLIQVVIVYFQYKSFSVLSNLDPSYFDNISGSFGAGGSHAIGYISILAIIASIALNKNMLWVVILIVVSFIVNVASENSGYYIIFIMFMFWVGVNVRVRARNVILGIVTIPLLLFILGVTTYHDRKYFEVVASRAIHMFLVSDNYDKEPRGRADLLLMASDNGGWTGRGIGAVSNIYLLDGYDSKLVHPQINISEASHLLTESGYIGLMLAMIVYAFFISAIFQRKRNKIISVLIFVSLLFYTAVLMNESHMLLFILSIYFMRVLEEWAFIRNVKEKPSNIF